MFSLCFSRDFLAAQGRRLGQTTICVARLSGQQQQNLASVIINEKWKSFAAAVLIVKLGQAIKNKLQWQ